MTCWICNRTLPKKTWRLCGYCFQERYVIDGRSGLKRRTELRNRNV